MAALSGKRRPPVQTSLLGGSSRAKPLFGKAFSPKNAKGSRSEDSIGKSISAMGFSFRKHCIIDSKAVVSLENCRRIAEESCPKEIFPDLLRRFPLEKFSPNKFRCDFSIEGLKNGRFERVYVEYMGLYRPNGKFSKKGLRRRHIRQVAFYTFIKTPLKRAVYKNSGFSVIEIFPWERRADWERKLKEGLSGISQEKTTISSYLS